MFKKMNQMVDNFPAFRKVRVKNTECVGQVGILRKINQFMGHLMSGQSFFKIQSVFLKMIVVTGDQEAGGAGWSQYPDVPEIYKEQTSIFYNVCRRGIGEEKVRFCLGGSCKTYR